MKTINKEQLIDKILKDIEYIEKEYISYPETKLSLLSNYYIALSNLIKD